MKRILIILLLAGLAGVFLAPPAKADEQLYTRQLTSEGYWSYVYGCWKWYPPSYSYAEYATPSYPSIDAEDFEARLLDIAQRRDKIEGAIRKQQALHNSRLELIDKLGFSGNFRIDSYAPAISYANPLRLNGYGKSYSSVGNYGVSGSTVYATPSVSSFSQQVDLYGPSLDLNVLFQQSASLTKGAQDLAGQANSGFQAGVGQATAGQVRVAEILAQGQAAKQALEASKAANQATINTTVTQPVIPVPVQGPILNPPQNQPQERVRRLQTSLASCLPCHAGAQAKGKLDLSAWDKITVEQKAMIRERITSRDEKLMMPPPADSKGEKIHRLAPHLLIPFLEN